MKGKLLWEELDKDRDTAPGGIKISKKSSYFKI